MTILVDNKFVSVPIPEVGSRKKFIGTLRIPVLIGLSAGAQEDRIATGVVTQDSVPVSNRDIFAIDRKTGRVLGWVTCAADGTYSIPINKARETLLVCLDDTAGAVQNDLVKRAFPQT
jgi:hypothetical protein